MAKAATVHRVLSSSPIFSGHILTLPYFLSLSLSLHSLLVLSFSIFGPPSILLLWHGRDENYAIPSKEQTPELPLLRIGRKFRDALQKQIEVFVVCPKQAYEALVVPAADEDLLLILLREV